MLVKEQFRSSKPLSKNGDPYECYRELPPKVVIICTTKSGHCLQNWIGDVKTVF